MNKQPIRVLLVDDEESVRKPLAEYLCNTHGFSVDAVADGNDALRLVAEAQGRYDVVLLDEILAEPPGGLEVLRQIKATYPEIEVILFTGWGMQAGIEALRAGAYRYFAKPFDKEELARTIRFAAEHGQARREHKIRTAFWEIANAINSTLDLEEILKRTCQAAVELFDVEHSGMVVFEDGEQGKVVAEFPDKGTLGCVIPVRGVPLEERLVDQQKELNIPDVEAEHDLGSVRDALLGFGIQSTLIVPVVLESKVVASFSLDAMGHKRTFYPNEIELCRSLANQVAVAVANARLYDETRQGREYMRSFYQATSEIITQRDPNKVLQHIVEIACRTTGARRAVVLLIEESGRPRAIATFGFDHHLDLAESVRPNGISFQVARSGQPQFIPDTAAMADAVNPAMLAEGVQAAACLPLSLMGKNVGVLWIQFSDKRTFSETEQHALQLYANQSAIAYSNARRMRELEQLKNAAEAMASKAEWKEVLQEIAKSAKQVLEADYTLIWPYDAERYNSERDKKGIFFPEDLVAENIPDDLLAKFRQDEPHPGSTTEHVLQNGCVAIEDLDSAQANFVGETTRGFLKKLAVKSFQGIRLDVAGEPLGVLFVDYKHARGFGEEDRRILENFATHAALTLKKARLHDQVRRSQEAARAIAQASTLEDLDMTLKATVEGAREVLRCNISTLYTFDEEKKRFMRMAGVGCRDEKNMRPPDEIAPSSSLWRIINLPGDENYHLSEDALNDDLLKGGFVQQEVVKSALGIRLRVRERRVGVMFINYRTPHRFAEDEIQDALQFADQAAVAIRNAQLHDEVRNRAEVMEGLYEAGKAITSTLSLEETLAKVAEQMLDVVGANCPQEGCFSHIALREGDKLRFVAACPTEMLAPLQKQIEIDLNLKGNHEIGIVGRCVKEGKPQKVDDVHSQEEKDYIEAVEKTQSQLSVPLKIGERIIGVLSIEHPKPAAFGDEDVQNIELLAAQATVAIENARLFEAAEQREKNLRAVLELSQTTISSLDLEQILKAACKASVELLKVDHSGLVLFDQDLTSGKVCAEYPEIGTVGVEFPLHGVPAEEQLIATKKPLMVPDVANEPGFEPVRDLLSELGTCSILIVPILSKGRILGSLGLDVMKGQRVFTEEEIELCQIFAAQAAVAIENARQYGETAQQLAARTALAWTGMLGSTWRHAVEKHALTIREQIQHLRYDMEQLPKTDSLAKRLSMIERLANQILEKPITPPLSAEEGVHSLPINDFLRERTKQLWAHEPYKSVSLKLHLGLDEQATVRASPEWLRRALDLLIDNAVEATAGLPERKIVISNQRRDNYAEISITDNGHGIPSDVLERLFREPIKKPQGAKGQGIGLLLAHMIMQTYGGAISCRETGATGTTMIISFPLES